jgi:hypothetical protein
MSKKRSADKKLLRGSEYIPDEEAGYIEQMVSDMKKQLNKLYEDGKILRAAHPKMHGCVKAEFTVLDNLIDDLRVGIFKEPRTFPAYVRFSNANSEIKHDYNKDTRGMAIKLFDVPGEKLHNEPKDANTQDLILIDNEVFVSKNVAEFQKILRSASRGGIHLLLFLLNPMHFSILGRVAKYQKRCHHVLDTQYYSATPYLLGNDRAVKYHVAPANESIQGGIVRDDENYLRSNMKRTLADHDVFFDFFVQFQTDADLMPIEDPTVKWNSPFIKMARIKIPKQEFDTDEQNHVGEDFSFSPWHSLTEHRPLGGLNRARQPIYYTMSNFWHERNSAYVPEA